MLQRDRRYIRGMGIEVLTVVDDDEARGQNIVLCVNQVATIREPLIAYLCGACNLPLVWTEPEYVRKFVFKCECGALNAAT